MTSKSNIVPDSGWSVMPATLANSEFEGLTSTAEPPSTATGVSRGSSPNASNNAGATESLSRSGS